ncbi:DNA alkylation repair protein [Flavobacteriaceae bacterium TP-CH-4]|uniref:DNA alkylation repair protein n=1 Tax=Pelagihabitans pacificus TaxID=2696054 RepID=A0A967E6L8_9FLAO|nr:DNA alkylation repair protein [Pelagihabitans pacificus]NHF59745.1 DNA alkylation repair protein [Pelagihabitans pacificus]
MIEQKHTEIRDFFIRNSNPAIVQKYARYFKEGFDGYGIETKVFEKQRDDWIKGWKNEMSLRDYLNLGDSLMEQGKFEEKSMAIALLQSEREHYTTSTFERIGNWFGTGIDNWATTDVLCMLVLSSFLKDGVISYEKLKEWTSADSQWQRRAVPVTLIELAKDELKPEVALSMVEPLMLDDSEYVQKGIGTLLRSLWKKYPKDIEDFLLQWKDRCGRLIVQYATEKMDKEYRKRFRKAKRKLQT